MAITHTSFLPHDTQILTIARAFLNIAFNVGSPGRLEDRVHRRLVRHHVIQREKAMRTTIATSKFAFLTVGVLALALLGTAGSASAGTWDQRHPRRAEVNDRLAIQNFRINRELREGEIGWRQARALHAEDHAIRQKERAMAIARGGTISRGEQRLLNHEESFVSHRIGY
jgi:hypothetical protein